MANPEKTTAHLTAQTLLEPALNAWQIYLDDQGRSIHTIKAFLADIHLLTGYLPPDRQLGAISTQDLNRFIEWMQHKRGVSCSPKTLSRRITAIKAFFRWLHRGGVILVDPAEKVIQNSVASPIPLVLTPAEIERVLDAAQKHRTAAKPDARPYLLVKLLLETGIKKGECLAISPNHIDFSEDGTTLFVRYASPANRNKERKIALSEGWVEAYHEYDGQYKLNDRLFPWSQRRLEYLLEDLGKEAGLDKHLSFDMCRWTCALSDWNKGEDHDLIRQKLGVSKIQWREINQKLRHLAGEE